MANEGTTDGDAFWAVAAGERRDGANGDPFPEADLLDRFFRRIGEPASVASVGCGPASVCFDLAARYPTIEFRGYDAVGAVVDANRERAAECGLENLSFAVGAIPDLAIDGRFDLVYCYGALHYVHDVERALRALYERVAPRGCLVFNYPNRLTRGHLRRDLGERGTDAASSLEELRERFAPVLDGANVLSYRRIAEVLGARPRSYWSAVDAPVEPWTARDNPCVYVRK
ncbi:class I SAM-dependent methyltransferase [Halomarina halobia]|uniref:Class I SAM-dependent methyltransferase n=1 Tax=Halomarina halobia TaxID=3033386 RepID=A0ABD6AAC9_9EURY|nr:class I SAM-dependent methyltransferase [Halomarina sp. PSR21]